MGVFETVILSYIIYMTVALYGITCGYHRCFSHREFKTSIVQETLMLYCGLLCGVRSPLAWAGVHRMHHAYSDTELDPHSPILMSKWRVFFSVYKVPTIPRKFIKDLLRNPRVMFFHKHRKIIWIAHFVITYFVFGPIAIAVNFLIIFYSYIGYGVLNTFGHDNKGPVNRFWISLIAPFEGQHRDHHERSHTKS